MGRNGLLAEMKRENLELSGNTTSRIVVVRTIQSDPAERADQRYIGSKFGRRREQ